MSITIHFSLRHRTRLRFCHLILALLLLLEKNQQHFLFFGLLVYPGDSTFCFVFTQDWKLKSSSSAVHATHLQLLRHTQIHTAAQPQSRYNEAAKEEEQQGREREFPFVIPLRQPGLVRACGRAALLVLLVMAVLLVVMVACWWPSMETEGVVWHFRHFTQTPGFGHTDIITLPVCN